MANHEIDEAVLAWETYLAGVEDWQALVEGIEPKIGGCGRVYELPSPLKDRPNESIAIADMRDMEFSEPHMHQGGETEIYHIIGGVGRVGVGSEIHEVRPGVTVTTPPGNIHCVYSPKQDIVLAVINTPPFKPENYVSVNETQAAMARNLLALRD